MTTRTAAAAAWLSRLGPLGFGSAALGNLYQAMRTEQSQATLAAARRAGIGFFDTAPHYGLGLAEERLGLVLPEWPRESAIISSKVGRLLTEDASPAGAAGSDLAAGFDVSSTRRRVVDLSTAGVEASVRASCARLGLDRLDIALLHDPEELTDDHRERLAGLEALDRMRQRGAVEAIGVGSKDPAVLRDLVTHLHLDLVMLAGRFTLLNTTGRALLDECARAGTAVIAVGVYNSGILANAEPDAGAMYDYAEADAQVLARALAVARVCQDHGVSLPQAAVQFPFTHPAVANVTLGLRSPQEVEQAADRMRAPIPQELWQDLAARGLVDVPGVR